MAVLQLGPVFDAVTAVRAAIVSDAKRGAPWWSTWGCTWTS